MATDAPDWLPATQLTVGNGFIVGAGGNQVAGLETITGVPASGILIAAPPAGQAIALYTVQGNITPAAGTGNRVELDAYINYPTTFSPFLTLKWAAGAQPFPVFAFFGGWVMQAGQPFSYQVTNVNLDDVLIAVTYRLVTP